MAKPRHDETPTSNTMTLAIMAIGGVLVAALVVWALTRTVEPATTTTTASDPGFTTATTPPAVADTGITAPTTSPIVAPPTGTTTDVQVPPPTATAVEGNMSEIKRIAVEDLRAQLNRGEVTIIDVRDAASFAQEHIPGSLNIPFASIEAQIDRIPKDKPIVTYCT